MILLAAIAFADDSGCTASDLRASEDGALQTYAELDTEGFGAARSNVDRLAGCVAEPLSVADVRDIHLVRALGAWLDKDSAGAGLALAGVRATDPAFELSADLAPPGSSLRSLWDTGLPSQSVAGKALVAGPWLVDGAPATSLPSGREVFVQRADGSLPILLPRGSESAQATGLLLGTAVAAAPPLQPTAPDRARASKPPLGRVGIGLAAGSLAMLGGAYATGSAYEANASPTNPMDGTYAANHGLMIGGSALGVAAAGLLVGAAVTGSF